LQIALMWIVSLAWVANIVIGWINPNLGQQAVNAAFMVVLAVLFRTLRRARQEGDDEPGGSAVEALDEVRRLVGDPNDRGSGEQR
jgi:hypothetical protein